MKRREKAESSRHENLLVVKRQNFLLSHCGLDQLRAEDMRFRTLELNEQVCEYEQTQLSAKPVAQWQFMVSGTDFPVARQGRGSGPKGGDVL